MHSPNASVAKGYVFAEPVRGSNHTSSKQGIPGVLVSNQREVVATDENGFYQLPVAPGDVLFITKPDGYALPLNRYRQPQFYYLHHPEGTPRELNLGFPGIEPTGPLPEFVNFSLIPAEPKTRFSAAIFGDIQPKTPQEIGFFRDLLAPDVAGEAVDFIVPLGDLAWDELSLYPLIRSTLGAIGKPVFTVCGNHDINMRAPDPERCTQTYRRYFGPDYYSFEYGQVHFVVLNTIGYAGWKADHQERGDLYGWIGERQLEWLANDLRHVPADRLLFFCTHIPIYTAVTPNDDYRVVLNRQRFFELLKERTALFAVSGHTHYIERVDLRGGGWEGPAYFENLIAGAACGAWWKGPRDPYGIPVRLGMDGSPNGYFVFEFDGSRFDYHFRPAGMPAHHQLSIRWPRGAVSPQGVAEQAVFVNVFAASTQATVHYRLDDGPPVPMTRVQIVDPYVQQFLEDHQADYPAWMYARKVAHLWKAPALGQLTPGLHRLEVEARDPDGKTYRGRQLFRVEEMWQPKPATIALETEKQ